MFRVYFGTEYGKNGGKIPKDALKSALAWAKARAVEAFGGYTLYGAEGGCHGLHGLVVEKSCVLELLTDDGLAVEALALGIKRRLNQESVVVSKIETDGGRFI